MEINDEVLPILDKVCRVKQRGMWELRASAHFMTAGLSSASSGSYFRQATLAWHADKWHRPAEEDPGHWSGSEAVLPRSCADKQGDILLHGLF